MSLIKSVTVAAVAFLISGFELDAQTNGTIKASENVRMCDQFGGSDAGAKIAACIADLPATGGIADATGLTGPQKATTTIIISKQVELRVGSSTLSTPAASPFFSVLAAGSLRIIGSGKYASRIFAACGNCNVITVASANALYVRDVQFSTAGTQTGGAYISLTGPGGATNAHSVIEGNIFAGCFICIDVGVAEAARISDNQFNNTQYRAIRWRNTSNADVGDSFITENAFASDTSKTDTAVFELQSGAGFSFTNNKLFQHKYGVLINLGSSGTGGGEFNIIGNRFDPFTTASIEFQRQAGATGAIASVIIANNRLHASIAGSPGGSGNLIDFATNAFPWISQIIIAGNLLQPGDTATGIHIGNNVATASFITGNHIYCTGGTSKGIVVGTGVAELVVDPNNVLCPTNYSISTPLRGLYLQDRIGFGVDPGVALAGPANFLNNTFLVWRNAANNEWINTIGLNSSNQTSIDPSGKGAMFGGEAIFGGASTFTQGSVGTSPGGGLVVTGKTGTTSDISVLNKSGSTVVDVPTGTQDLRMSGLLRLKQYTFATLPTTNITGSVIYCTDCNPTCTAGGGTGRTCFGENGAWTR